MISERFPCDVYEIEAAEPYSDDYDATVQRNADEQEAEARPEIANLPSSIEPYDSILMGSPIWNVRPPRIMLTLPRPLISPAKPCTPSPRMPSAGWAARSTYTMAVRGPRLAMAWPCSVRR